MRRAASLFVGLLAALVLLHGGLLPHCAGGYLDAMPAAVQVHDDERPEPAAPPVAHVAHVDRTGLPDRGQPDHRVPPESIAAPHHAGAQPDRGVRHRAAALTSAPDLAGLRVYRC